MSEKPQLRPAMQTEPDQSEVATAEALRRVVDKIGDAMALLQSLVPEIKCTTDIPGICGALIKLESAQTDICRSYHFTRRK